MKIGKCSLRENVRDIQSALKTSNTPLRLTAMGARENQAFQWACFNDIKYFTKMGNWPISASFCLFLSFSQYDDKFSIQFETELKKCRCCAWDLNLRRLDGRHRLILWAMADPMLSLSISIFLPFNLSNTVTCHFTIYLWNKNCQCNNWNYRTLIMSCLT